MIPMMLISVIGSSVTALGALAIFLATLRIGKPAAGKAG